MLMNSNIIHLHPEMMKMIYWVSMTSLISKTEPGCDSRDCYCILICFILLIEQFRTENTC